MLGYIYMYIYMCVCVCVCVCVIAKVCCVYLQWILTEFETKNNAQTKKTHTRDTFIQMKPIIFCTKILFSVKRQKALSTS